MTMAVTPHVRQNAAIETLVPQRLSVSGTRVLLNVEPKLNDTSKATVSLVCAPEFVLRASALLHGSDVVLH